MGRGKTKNSGRSEDGNDRANYSPFVAVAVLVN